MSTRHDVRHTHRAEWLLAVGTLVLIIFYYLVRADTVGVFSADRGWTSLTPGVLPPPLHYLSAAVLLGVLPVAAARLLTGMSLSELGLGAGDWRSGLRWLAVGIPLGILAGWIGSTGTPMRAVYPLDSAVTAELHSFLPYAALQFLYYGSWEVLFRGVLLFGLLNRIGVAPANLSQTGLSVTAHFGRAWGETVAAFPAGLLFGALALRLRSMWYIAVIHWAVGVSCDWFIIAR